MSIIEKAINFAAKAHDGQNRKSTNIPYISHPFAVGMILQQSKCSDEVIAAGILHDTLEDTYVTADELSKQFGDKIAKLVEAASEPDKSLPWKERKRHTINVLSDATTEEIQVIIADKLHNLRSIRADIELQGEIVWSRFNRGKRDQHWYYSSVVKALSSRKKEFKLIGKLEKEVKAVFGSIEFISSKEISILFSCAYGIHDSMWTTLENNSLAELGREISEEAERLYRNDYDATRLKLEDLSLRGIEFQSNSDGPFILAGFCIALQRNMGWTDDELFQYFKRNQRKL
ncbi:HD domain-containing protein [Bacillus sp. FJAT-22090]|uniref:HD domain-containing protein n=1 Tax=Bacillus sp. FJAT-22090 TaxID=1581038 RepID=UPI0011AA31D7|nr:HD domain-containing protein [Bacillus sp. FJAT-22090]